MSESTHVKMPHCWKSHDAAHMSIYETKSLISTFENQHIRKEKDVDLVWELLYMHVPMF